MTKPELEVLYERYRAAGDVAALGDIFDRCAPELLRVARRLAPSRGEADDLVQATFLTAIERSESFQAGRRLVPWLIGILALHAREQRRAQGREIDPRRMDARSAPDPGCVVQQVELARTVDEALARLPEPYRSVLMPLLKDDKPAVEIAREQHKSPGVVRMQIHRGLSLLRQALPTGAALGVAAWLSPGRALASVRARVLEAARGATAGRGHLASTGRSGPAFVRRQGWPLAAGLVTLAGVATLIVLRTRNGDVEAGPAARAGRAVQAHVAGAESLARAEPADARPHARARGRVALDTGPGSDLPAQGAPADRDRPGLRLRVRWSDGSAAAGVGLEVIPWNAPDPFRQTCELRADAKGEAFLAELPAGHVGVHPDRGGGGSIELFKGQAAEMELVLPRGITLFGSVRDELGRPLDGARIWLSGGGTALRGQVAASSGPDGEYELRDVEPGRWIAASAAGCLPGGAQRIEANSEGIARIESKLRQGGGGLYGVVRDAHGRPFAGAEVMVGEEHELLGLQSSESRPPSARVRTGAQGEFELAGLAPGLQHVRARGGDWATWRGEAQIEAHHRSRLEIVLARGASIDGVVQDADGRPLSGVFISSGPFKYFETLSTLTAADGGFALHGLPAGPVELRATADGCADVVSSFDLALSSAACWQVVMGQVSPSIAGSLCAASGAPLSNWMVAAVPLGRPDARQPWSRTDAQGLFRLVRLPAEGYTLDVRAPDRWEGEPVLRLCDVPSGCQDLLLHVPARPASR